MLSTVQPYFNPKAGRFTKPISAGFSPTIKEAVSTGAGGILYTPGQVLANCQTAGKPAPDRTPTGVSYGDTLRGLARLTGIIK